MLEDMRVEHPETFRFFADNALKWYSIEDGIHVTSWAKVITFQPDGNENVITQFRYNNYDLAPIDYLTPEQIPKYYEHTKILNSYLRSPKYIAYYRLNVGEMVIIDNHRVCHGRTAFTGDRNLVGCYIGCDDWKSKYNVLKKRFSQ